MKLLCTICRKYICTAIDSRDEGPIVEFAELSTDIVGDNAHAMCQSCERELK